MVNTGSSAYLAYGWETGSFGGGASSRDKIFGKDQKITNVFAGNNPIPLADLNSIVLTDYAFGLNTYRLNFDAVLSNPWLFQAIFNDAATPISQTTYYTHTWSLAKTVKSMEVEIGLDTDTNVVRKMKGAVMPNLTLNASVGNAARISGEIASGILGSLETTLGTPGTNADPGTGATHPAFTFAQGTLSLVDSSGSSVAAVNQLQSVELTIDQQAELLYGFSSPNSVDAFRKLTLMTGRFNASHVDPVRLQDLLDRVEFAGTLSASNGNSNAGKFKLQFTNGLSGASKRLLKIEGIGVIYPEHSTNYEPGEPIFEDVPFQIREANVTVETSSATAL